MIESKLSPPASAVWDAFNRDEAGVFVDYGDKLAAALRAAADQVVPEYETTPGGSKIWPSELVPSIRAGLLAIADELDGH